MTCRCWTESHTLATVITGITAYGKSLGNKLLWMFHEGCPATLIWQENLVDEPDFSVPFPLSIWLIAHC